MLDYRIDTFLTLCECMNYRKTAEILHISQPAVTQQIHYLENQYGQKLFEYENRRLVKTEAAAVLEKYARAAKLQEKDLREKLENKPIHSTASRKVNSSANTQATDNSVTIRNTNLFISL